LRRSAYPNPLAVGRVLDRPAVIDWSECYRANTGLHRRPRTRGKGLDENAPEPKHAHPARPQSSAERRVSPTAFTISLGNRSAVRASPRMWVGMWVRPKVTNTRFCGSLAYLTLPNVLFRIECGSVWSCGSVGTAFACEKIAKRRRWGERLFWVMSRARIKQSAIAARGNK
jgi:hypothetical protein